MNKPASHETLIESDHELLKFVLTGSPRHWRTWADKVDIDDHSHIAFQLLPAVYRNLLLGGEEHPWLARLKGVYRQQWSRQKMMLIHCNNACDVLDQARIDYLEPLDIQLIRLLDEPAILKVAIPRLTVRADHAPSALNHFLDRRWCIDSTSFRKKRYRDRLTASEWQLTAPDGSRLILTERYQNWYSRPTINDAIWSRSCPHHDRPNRRSVALPELYCAALLMDMHNPKSLRWAPIIPLLAPLVLEQCAEQGLFMPDEHLHEVMCTRLKFIAEHSSVDMAQQYAALAALPRSLETAVLNNCLRSPLSTYQRVRRLHSRWGGMGNIARYLQRLQP